MRYGRMLLEFRAKHGLNQKELAEIIGVSVTMVHNYEAGGSQPHPVNRIRIDEKMKQWENEIGEV